VNSYFETQRPPASVDADRFAGMLRAYPHVEARQIEQMVALFPRLTILEMGLLSADRFLSEPLEAFMRDQAPRLKTSWRDKVVFEIVIVSAILLLCWLALAMIYRG
jgi:hypothetical protein